MIVGPNKTVSPIFASICFCVIIIICLNQSKCDRVISQQNNNNNNNNQCKLNRKRLKCASLANEQRLVRFSLVRSFVRSLFNSELDNRSKFDMCARVLCGFHNRDAMWYR